MLIRMEHLSTQACNKSESEQTPEHPGRVRIAQDKKNNEQPSEHLSTSQSPYIAQRLQEANDIQNKTRRDS